MKLFIFCAIWLFSVIFTCRTHWLSLNIKLWNALYMCKIFNCKISPNFSRNTFFYERTLCTVFPLHSYQDFLDFSLEMSRLLSVQHTPYSFLKENISLYYNEHFVQSSLSFSVILSSFHSIRFPKTFFLSRSSTKLFISQYFFFLIVTSF